MRKEPSRSVLPAKDIEDWIKKEYKTVSLYKVHFSNRKEFSDIYIEVQTEKQGFPVTTPYRFMEDDVLKVANRILEEKGISAEELTSRAGSPLRVKHTDGDSGEPMDYGSYEFEGVSFRWKDEDGN